MSHLNMGNPLLDKVFSRWCEEFRKKNLHLLPHKQVSCGTVEGHGAFCTNATSGEHTIKGAMPANEAARTLVVTEASEYQASPAGKPLSLWARAWLKVAKGIIG